MKNVFVALGQNHINNFEKLFENNLVEKGENILLAGSNVQFNEKYWDSTYVSNLSFNNSATSIFNQFSTIFIKIKAYSKLVKNIKSLEGQEVTVYVSYIEDVLSNFVFFSLSKNAKAVIVEDGTLNYYDHSLRNISTLKFYLKSVIALIYNLRFKKYKGHSSGADYSFVSKQFLTFPERAFIKKKAQQLPIVKEKPMTLSNAIYIIGQESYGTIIGQKKYDNVVTEFFNKIKELEAYQKAATVYYKPHRNGKQFSKAYLDTVFFGKEVSVLHSNKTSEEIYFEELKSENIITLDSSTVINLYSRMAEEDRKKVSFFVYPKINDKLSPLFNVLGFKFLK